MKLPLPAIALLMLLLGWFTPALTAQLPTTVSRNGDWYTVKMHRTIGRYESQAVAESKLLNDARLEAVAHAAGIEVRQMESVHTSEGRAGSDFQQDYLFLSFQESAGRIVEERTPQFTRTNRDEQVLLYLLYEARVAKESGRRAPSFNGFLRTSQPAYRIGDTIKVSVESTKDAALYLFSVLPDGKINMLWPNQLDRNPQLTAGMAKQLPGAHNRYSFVAEWPEQVPKSGAVQEALLAIFFLGESYLFDPKEAFTRSYELAELNRVLMQVPRELRTEVMTSYSIVP